MAQRIIKYLSDGMYKSQKMSSKDVLFWLGRQSLFNAMSKKKKRRKFTIKPNQNTFMWGKVEGETCGNYVFQRSSRRRQ
ncbi:MAG: hypothetical protein D6714_14655 [Bacteroidetes bacterium]|nr:MAG: hypothetical protein D6714_14655 [Bacteroidota bacterium]